ncbi:MAG: DUF86 domain-containing protein [Anaerolineales bacterium]
MEDAEMFISGQTFDDFTLDKKTVNAVIRSIEVIGEAAKNIPEGVREKYPIIPWKEMAGMRDKVIHFYFGVDLELVWISVKESIPSIRPLLEDILQELESDEG